MLDTKDIIELCKMNTDNNVFILNLISIKKDNTTYKFKYYENFTIKYLGDSIHIVCNTFNIDTCMKLHEDIEEVLINGLMNYCLQQSEKCKITVSSDDLGVNYININNGCNR